MPEKHIALNEMYSQIPRVTYVELDSTFHWSLTKLGWKEIHRLDVDGKIFIKMEKPDA